MGFIQMPYNCNSKTRLFLAVQYKFSAASLQKLVENAYCSRIAKVCTSAKQ